MYLNYVPVRKDNIAEVVLHLYPSIQVSDWRPFKALCQYLEDFHVTLFLAEDTLLEEQNGTCSRKKSLLDVVRQCISWNQVVQRNADGFYEQNCADEDLEEFNVLMDMLKNRTMAPARTEEQRNIYFDLSSNTLANRGALADHEFMEEALALAATY